MKIRSGIALFVASFTVFASVYVPVKADDAGTKTVFYTEDGVMTPYTTTARTVREFLNERGITLAPRDTLNMDYSDPLGSGSKIEMKHGFYINASVDGNITRFKVSQDTPVGTFIRLFEEQMNQQYYYTGSMADILYPNQVVLLTAFREETVTEQTEIPFNTQTNENDGMVKGTEKVTQEGQPGQKTTTYRVRYLGDEEQSREIISETIDISPVDKIVEEGTAQPTPTPRPAPSYVDAGGSTDDFSYSRVYTMVATAYTAGPESTGKSPGMPGYGITASGMRVRHGVVSVDPRVIPLGTHLYVEGYGSAIAADTGGAIKGNRIDVYVETLSEAYRWGRRTVKVYVLD